MGLFDKLFGTRSQREIKKIQPIVDKILGLEIENKALSEEELKGKTALFKERLAQGETLDDLLPEAFAAMERASADFAQGAVGAGKGMTCHDLKGGIGSSSRIVEVGGEKFTIGVLVLTNHGSLRDLTILGKNVGADIERRIHEDTPDEGSCIMIVGTDLPVTSRQLGRIIRRCSVGLARLGSYIGHGSGEVMVGFSTANRIPAQGGVMELRCIHESHMDDAFRAVAEATEEAVLNSMLNAKTVTGYSGKVRRSLAEFRQG